MVALMLILRAYRLKKATDRLMMAKENAIRIEEGKRPRYPWYEECWSWMVNLCTRYLCRAFCPCCLSTKAKYKNEYSASFLRRLCLDGTFESYALKSCLGFLFGLLLTVVVFFFLLNQLAIDPRSTTVFCCLLGLFLTLGLAFSPEMRCISLLMLPEFCSSRGRVALLAYAYILVMSGPAKNAMRNTNILVESMNCGQEVIIKQTKAILKSIFAPLAGIVDMMRSVLKSLKDFARMMKQAFIAIRDLFLEIIGAIKSMFSWLKGITKVCNSKFGSPYQRCNSAFDDAIDDCNKKLGVFKFLCHIVSAVKYICEIARIVDLMCAISKAIKSGIIEPLKEKVKSFTRQMYNEFYVNVTFVHFYNYSLEQSKSFEEIRGDIAQEVRDRTKWIAELVDWSDLMVSFVLLNLLFRAYVYRLRYLTADHFDNVYITHEFRELDDRRFRMDKETVLPLSVRERRRYVSTCSLRMAHSESRKLATSGTLILLSAIQVGFYLLLDSALYRFLLMIRVHGKVQTKASVPAHMQIHVSGDGVMADMYRRLITSFDPVAGSIPEFDTTQCLPNPIPIDDDRYQQIGIVFLLCLLLAVVESYGLRLRHVVCGGYYPGREKLRAIWLYNHILRTRGGLLKFLRRKIRRKINGDDTLEDISLIDHLSAKYRLFGRLMKALGRDKIFCICCSESGKPNDYENFKRCATPGCKGIYCYACFDDINNLCTICMKPVDYGDLSDISEERDSSDDEEPTRILRIFRKPSIDSSDDEIDSGESSTDDESDTDAESISEDKVSEDRSMVDEDEEFVSSEKESKKGSSTDFESDTDAGAISDDKVSEDISMVDEDEEFVSSEKEFGIGSSTDRESDTDEGEISEDKVSEDISMVDEEEEFVSSEEESEESSDEDEDDFEYQYDERLASNDEENIKFPDKPFYDVEAGQKLVLARVNDYDEGDSVPDGFQAFAEHFTKRQNLYL